MWSVWHLHRADAVDVAVANVRSEVMTENEERVDASDATDSWIPASVPILVDSWIDRHIYTRHDSGVPRENACVSASR